MPELIIQKAKDLAKRSPLAIFVVVTVLTSGCWRMETSQTTIEFSRRTGKGSLLVNAKRIAYVSDGIEPKEKESPVDDLKQLAKTYQNVLLNLGWHDVKSEVKTTSDAKVFSGLLQGKFDSLSQMPFFEEVRTRWRHVEDDDKEKKRIDLVVEMVLNKESDPLALGKNNTYLFHSTDSDAPILEAYPPGDLDASHHSVTWSHLWSFTGEGRFKVRLQGVD